MRFACRTTEATDTHLEYVLLTDFPLQELLRERASMWCYTHIVRLVYHPTIYIQVFQLVLPSNHARSSPRLHAIHTPRPPHHSWFDHPHIWPKTQVTKAANHYVIPSTTYYSPLLGPNICVQSQTFMVCTSSFIADRHEQPRIASKVHTHCQQTFCNSENRNVYHVLVKMWIRFKKFRHLVRIYLEYAK
jgi:hypothetical protein